MVDDFHDGLLKLVPKLRAHAFALTRDRSSVEDLIQDTIMSALVARGTFTPGTNLAAWAHTILRHRFISAFRKRRHIVDLDAVPEAAVASPESQEDTLVLKELARALTELEPGQREALTMAVVLNMSHKAISEAMNCSEGTTKSRVFRARRTLRLMLLGEDGQARRSLSHTRASSGGHRARQTRPQLSWRDN